MDATENEMDIAMRYMNGEYTEVQFNYLVHTSGSDAERMDRILEKLSYQTPLANACKFIVLCMFAHFAFCLVYSLTNL